MSHHLHIMLRTIIPFYADGEGWQRQHHIYDRPFYYIDYYME